MIELNEPTSEKKFLNMIQKKLKKGNKYILWKLKNPVEEKGYSFFSIIKEVEEPSKLE